MIALFYGKKLFLARNRLKLSIFNYQLSILKQNAIITRRLLNNRKLLIGN